MNSPTLHCFSDILHDLSTASDKFNTPSSMMQFLHSFVLILSSWLYLGWFNLFHTTSSATGFICYPFSLHFSTHLVISFGLMIFKRHPYMSTTSKCRSVPNLTFSIILFCLTAYEATWMTNRHTSTLTCSKQNTKSLSSNPFHHSLLQFKVSNSNLPTS